MEGKDLAEIRKLAGLTQFQVAVKAERTQSWVFYLERGKLKPLDSIRRYLGALGATAKLVVTLDGQDFEVDL